MKKFEAGKSYVSRFATDADSAIVLSVVSRTDKTIKTSEGKTLRIKVCPFGDGEFVFPYGRYSMAPIVRAARPRTA